MHSLETQPETGEALATGADDGATLPNPPQVPSDADDGDDETKKVKAEKVVADTLIMLHGPSNERLSHATCNLALIAFGVEGGDMDNPFDECQMAEIPANLAALRVARFALDELDRMFEGFLETQRWSTVGDLVTIEAALQEIESADGVTPYVYWDARERLRMAGLDFQTLMDFHAAEVESEREAATG
jgi:hypothetical protein